MLEKTAITTFRRPQITRFALAKFVLGRSFYMMVVLLFLESVLTAATTYLIIKAGRDVANDEFLTAARQEFRRLAQRWDAKPPRHAAPKEFDHHFRETALPSLELLARRYARRIVQDAETHGFNFGECLEWLLREAIRRGAWNLSDPVGLEDHLGSYLAEQIVALDP